MCNNIKLKPIVSLNLTAVPAAMRGETIKEAVLPVLCRIVGGGKLVKFAYSEKATKFCKISTLLLSVCTVDKSKVEISQKFVAFLECMNFKSHQCISMAESF